MRLIDADVLIERLKKDNPQTSKLKWAQILADNAPTIDAEPVVRCKDCKHRSENECPMFHEEWIARYDSVTEDGDDWLNINDYTRDDGFCDWGERREA